MLDHNVDKKNTTMNYINARSTQMLATHCAVCARPLRDANSVECGVGPDCRKRYGFDTAQGELSWNEAIQLLDGVVSVVDITAWGMDARRAANALVHRIACEQTGDAVVAMVQAIRALGYVVLADRIAERLAKIVVEDAGDHYVVKAPYKPEAVDIMRAVPGRRWDGANKVTTFPKGSRRELKAALDRAYPGELYLTPKGLRQLAA